MDWGSRSSDGWAWRLLDALPGPRALDLSDRPDGRHPQRHLPVLCRELKIIQDVTLARIGRHPLETNVTLTATELLALTG
jgi:hypothetical protein